MSTVSLVTRTESGAPRPAVEILISKAFRARYELAGALGSGAMGMVVRALDRAMNREVAIKFMVAPDADLLQRFLQEGRLMARISHPNVAPVYDLESMGGHPYIVTELLEGGTLRSRLADGAMAPAEAVAIVAACLDGLAACHAKGILHRDLKPDNILFAKDGTPKLVDLGLAKDLAAKSITETGSLVGTPRYMAPEQVRGEGAGFASDIHAMGVILYELVTGKPPYRGENLADTLRAVMADPPPPFEGPPALVRAVKRALAKQPAERMDAAAFAAALRTVQLEPRPSRPLRAASRAMDVPRRWAPWVAGVAVVACAVAVASWPARTPVPVASPVAPATPSARALEPEELFEHFINVESRYLVVRGRFAELKKKYGDALGWVAPPPRDEVLRLGRDLRDALAAAHAILREVSPERSLRADALRALVETLACQCEFDLERIQRMPGRGEPVKNPEPTARTFREGFRAAAHALGLALARPAREFVGAERWLVALLSEVRMHGHLKHRLAGLDNKLAVESERDLVDSADASLRPAAAGLWWLPLTTDQEHPKNSTPADVRRELEALGKAFGRDPFGPLYDRLSG